MDSEAAGEGSSSGPVSLAATNFGFLSGGEFTSASRADAATIKCLVARNLAYTKVLSERMARFADSYSRQTSAR